MYRSSWHSVCNPSAHFHRRTLLASGGGALMMSALARRLATASEASGADPARPRNVILLWLDGGPSQLETFDPHARSSIGGEVKDIPTSVRGVRISELLPQSAEQMHLGTIIRSVTGKEGDHPRAVYNAKTGYRPDPTLEHPSIGAVMCHASGIEADIPRHISILPGGAPGRGGYLGAAYDAFKMDDPAGPVPDISSGIDQERYDRRVSDLYHVVEREFKQGRLVELERNRTLHQTATDAALRMMSSEQLDAFNVSKEPQAERDAFGDTAFGRGCLAASRLVEVGARCVEVTLGGWDSHINNFALQKSGCETLDPALAALLRRLEERELLESTLVVCGGEFGRTPSINPAGGRDHWPHGFSTFVAGCGIRRGSVYGETSSDPKLDRDQPLGDVRDPVTVGDVHATILSALGIDYEEELDTPVGRPMRRSEGTPIESILA